MQTLHWELPASRGATTPPVTSCPLATPAQHSSACPYFLHISAQSHLPGVSDNPPPRPKRPVLPPSLSISLLSPGGKGAPCTPDTLAAPAEPTSVEDKDPTPSRVATLRPAPRQPLPARQPHLAFSHIQDSDLVRVVRRDLVKELH